MTPLPAARTASAPCRICGQPVRWLAPATDYQAVCPSAACRMVLARAAAMEPAAGAHYLQLQADLVRATARQARERARLLQDKRQREEEEHAAHWDAAERRLGDLGRQGLLRLVLPSGPRTPVRLPRERRARYRAHLQRIAEEALAVAGPSEEEMPPGQSAAPPLGPAAAALAGRLCAACAGGCCTGGGDEAYLTARTLRRVMAARPELTPRQVVAAYMRRLAPRTESGSCINHTAAGCSLPPEMRSDVCHRFLCPQQMELRARAAAGTVPAGAVVVVRRQDQWMRDRPGRPNEVVAFALVQAGGSIALPAPGTTGPAGLP